MDGCHVTRAIHRFTRSPSLPPQPRVGDTDCFGHPTSCLGKSKGMHEPKHAALHSDLGPWTRPKKTIGSCLLAAAIYKAKTRDWYGRKAGFRQGRGPQNNVNNVDNISPIGIVW